MVILNNIIEMWIKILLLSVTWQGDYMYSLFYIYKSSHYLALDNFMLQIQQLEKYGNITYKYSLQIACYTLIYMGAFVININDKM